MKKVLVSYITHSGTTRDVAEAVAEELGKAGCEAEAVQLDQVKDLSAYDAVVLGAPMIIGWHRDAIKYLKNHNAELQQKPLALFMTGMSLVDSPKPDLPEVDIHIDEKFSVAPQNPARLTSKEKFSTIRNYLEPVVKVAPKSLSSIAIFGGRLDMYRLKWYDALFVMLIVGAKPGEKRNWPDIRAWAAGLPASLKLA